SVPNTGGQTFALEVQDRRGPDHLAGRAAAVAAFDQAERKERLKAGKPLSRLPRQVDVDWTMRPVPVELGASREQLLQALPALPSVAKQNIPDGLRVTFTGSPSRNAGHVLRQLLIRWDASGRVGEVRARYEDGPAAANGNGVQGLLGAFRKRCGAA